MDTERTDHQAMASGRFFLFSEVPLLMAGVESQLRYTTIRFSVTNGTLAVILEIGKRFLNAFGY